MLLFFVKILYSIGFIALGYNLIKFRKIVKGWTGSFVRAEQYLGSGGTYTVLVFLGLFLIFLGVLRPFGGLELLFGAKQMPQTSQQTSVPQTP